MKCHPDQPARRWSNESAALEHDCQNIKEIESDNAGGSQTPEIGTGAATEPDNTGGSQPADDTGAVINNDTNTGTKDEVKKTTKRNHSAGKK